MDIFQRKYPTSINRQEKAMPLFVVQVQHGLGSRL